ncbi:MAG: 23S rRNA pseudouridine(1911/1915/1917) synthase RluD [Rhodocyclaceae bacterium]|nr:23S rRNA pseudouridine(1911/1915/1917) synthase RluD [Rhodocyclaceae bacterium]
MAASDAKDSASDYNEAIIPATLAGSRLDAALAAIFPAHSRSRLQAWLIAGYITLDGQRARPKHKVRGGERVCLTVPLAASSPTLAEAIPLTIVYEDESLLVIDKPAGLVVHPGHGHERGTLMNALLHHAPQLTEIPRAGIVHRLDKDTSGLLVVAKTLAAQTYLVRALAARRITREYWALVVGDLAQAGVIDAPIGRHPVERVKMAVRPGGKPARTHYEPLMRFGVATLVLCRLETGRTHQIRVHMAALGHALVGDPVYGRRKCADVRLARFSRQALHAQRLCLVHPVSGAPLCWESPLPADLATLLEALRGA